MVLYMKLLLVRHASAEDSHPLGDEARALDEAGRKQFRKQARKLAKEFEVKRIVTSPLVRAVQTAEILAEVAEVLEVIVRGELAGNARDILKLVDQFRSGTALVGHNPSLSDAARLLTRDSEVVDMKKGCGMAVEKVGEGWEILWRTDL
jgi:phosphohistidine phosphatase